MNIDIRLSYTWVQEALQGAGLVAKRHKRGSAPAAHAVRIGPVGGVRHDEVRVLVDHIQHVVDIAETILHKLAARTGNGQRPRAIHDLVEAVDAVVAEIRDVAAGVVWRSASHCENRPGTRSSA